MQSFPLGSLVAAALASSFSFMSTHAEESKNEEEAALNPKEWRPFRVKSVENLTHNTSLIRFALPSETQRMGLPVASCLMARAKIDGKQVARPYTPVSSNEEAGMMELIVKGYPQGKLSKHIAFNLKVGDELEMKGPFKKYPYKANVKKKIGMIAGGSGITPMMQVIREILRNPSDETEVSLLFANVTEEDIILRNELDALAHLYPTRFRVHYVLDKPPTGWNASSGYITSEMIKEFMPEPSDDNLVCVCGPPALMFHISGNKAKDKSQGELQGLLKELNYTSMQVFKF